MEKLYKDGAWVQYYHDGDLFEGFILEERPSIGKINVQVVRVNDETLQREEPYTSWRRIGNVHVFDNDHCTHITSKDKFTIDRLLEDANNKNKKRLIDYALETRNKELFNKLTGKKVS